MFGSKFGLLKFGLGSTSIITPTIGIPLTISIPIPAGSTVLFDFYNDMVYIENREITEFVDGNGFPLFDMKIQKIVVENAGLTGTLKIKEGWL